MQVVAARARSAEWSAWDSRYGEAWVRALDAALQEGMRPGDPLPTRLHLESLRRPNPSFDRWAAALVEGGRVLGGAKLGLPLVEDLGIAGVELLGVEPAARRRGGGTALAAWVREAARAAGRDTLTADVERPAHVPAESWPGSCFARRQGLALGLLGRSRELALPVPPEREAALRAEAAERAVGYRVSVWEGATPEADRDRMAHLRRRMSTDAPAGDVPHEEERWDAERVAAQDDRLASLGARAWTAVAVAPDGEWVGFSQVLWRPAVPEDLTQEDTLVLLEHRGRRLGLALKLEVLAAASRAVPGARRIRTWNADSNGPMIAVNRAMGYVEVTVGEDWFGPV